MEYSRTYREAGSHHKRRWYLCDRDTWVGRRLRYNTNGRFGI